MAKVVNPLNSQEARGSVGAYTYSTHRGSSVVRTRTGPAVQYSARQVAVRGCTAQATAQWKLLTDSQRSLWEVYAREHELCDWSGSPRRISGYNWFVRVNCVAYDAGFGPFTVPPKVSYPAPAPSLLLAFSNYSVEVRSNPDGSWLRANSVLDVWSPGPVSASRHPTRKDAKHLAYVSPSGFHVIGPVQSTDRVSVWGRYVCSQDGFQTPFVQASVLVRTLYCLVTATIRGSAPSYSPVPGAVVHVGSYTATSNAAGYAEVLVPVAGSYMVSVSHNSYPTTYLGSRLCALGGTVSLGYVGFIADP